MAQVRSHRRLRLPRAVLPLAAGAVCLGLAALTMLAPSAPTTDPWGWIVWGREVMHLDLATDVSGSPSWKPLPVMVTAPLSLAGSAAPTLWVLFARASALVGLVFAFRIAARLVGDRGVAVRWAAGIVAAGGLVLTAGWIRPFSHAFTEPLAITLLLAAIDRHLAGRPRAALVLGALVAASRPEAAPLVGLYGALIWRRSEAGLLFVAAVLAALPALWLIPDWIGSGDPFHGSRIARELLLGDVPELSKALRYAPVPLVAAAIAGTVLAAWQHDRRFVEVAGLAGAWAALLRLMMAAGYPASPRYFFLPAAVVCVVGAAGAVRLAVVPRSAWLRAPLVLAAAGLLAWSFAPRIEDSKRTMQLGANRARAESDLGDAVTRAGGAALSRCGRPRMPQGLRWTRGVVAWRLEVPLRQVAGVRLSGGRRAQDRLTRGQGSSAASGGTVTVTTPRQPAVLFIPVAGMRVRFSPPNRGARVERLGSAGPWVVYATAAARCRQALAARGYSQ